MIVCPFHGAGCRRYTDAPLATMLLWPYTLPVPVGWERLRRQPLVEFPEVVEVVESMPERVLERIGYARSDAGWLLPDLPRYIMRMRP